MMGVHMLCWGLEQTTGMLYAFRCDGMLKFTQYQTISKIRSEKVILWLKVEKRLLLLVRHILLFHIVAEVI